MTARRDEFGKPGVLGHHSRIESPFSPKSREMMGLEVLTGTDGRWGGPLLGPDAGEELNIEEIKKNL